MESLTGLLYGFSVALTPGNLIACFLGVLLGTIVGVLPGIGPVGAMALLFPSTFGLNPATAMIMLSGIYYGTMYGGSTTSILLNVPGEATSVVTCIDGYQMSRRGRAGAALAVAAVGSFVAGTVGVVGLQFLAPILAEWAVKFGSPEFFAFMLVGLILVSQIGETSVVRSLIMVCLGLALGTVGMDSVTGMTRFTFGHIALGQGIDLIPVAMGLYGVSEVLFIAENITGIPDVIKVKLKELLPTRKEWGRAIPAVLRGSVLGFFVGLIPGPATILSTFYSYTLEKRISKHPQEFGKGAIEGVAGPESANNSASVGVMVPLLSLGLPFGAAAAMLLGGLMIHGVTPGPLLVSQRPDIFWGVVASLYIGNLMLLVLNLPLVGLFVNILRIPQHLLMALILLICLIGAFSVNNSPMDIWVLIGMGITGYFLRKLGFNMAPLILGLVLGPLMERRLSESLIMTRGDVLAIITRPLTALIFLLCLIGLCLPHLIRLMKPFYKKKITSVLSKIKGQ
jgi:putative tricarboxylic transport membrane protein